MRARLAGCRSAELAAVARADVAAELLATLDARLATELPATLAHRRRHRRGRQRRARPQPLAGARSQAPRARHRDARARAHRHRLAQGRLQQGVRLLPRDHQRAPRPRSRGLPPPPDAGQRGALHHARAQGARARDPRRRGAPRQLEVEEFGRVRERDRRSRRDLARPRRRAGHARRARVARHGRGQPRLRRPRLLEPGAGLRIRDGRHPVVEQRCAATSSPTTPTRSRESRRSCSSPARTWAASRPTCARSR